MTAIVNLRQHPRHAVQFKSLFSLDGVRVEDAIVLDISLGGCRIQCGRWLPPSTQMELHIRPDRHASVYVSRAIVQWVENVVLGVSFAEVSDIESATLGRLLCLLPILRSGI